MSAHFSKDAWLAYVTNRLPAEQREAQEAHLYDCEDCLSIYMTCLADDDLQLPPLENETVFTDHLMQSIANLATDISGGHATTEPHVQPAKRWHRTTIVHYALAAGITLILMSTGMFQQLFLHTAQVAANDSFKQERPFSEKLVQRTVKLLDTLQTSTKGGTFHE